MTAFPPDTKFKYPWRAYQRRVLQELDRHLEDKHLHIIAPPGSGKTVLGLETMLRLNRPTLILAPTLAVRRQWVDRFCELFLQTEKVPAWISEDIRNPGFLTVVTYQGLHAACQAEGEGDENFYRVVAALRAKKVQTVIADEAHHLKNQWWQTLTRLKTELQPVFVGLTATPPYDVTVREWQRYCALNGPVDAEISVPELVIERDLCPHQDLIYFSKPTAEEAAVLTERRLKAENLFRAIENDETLKRAIIAHPAWQTPAENLDWVYSNIEIYSAFLIFLFHNGAMIPSAHLKIIDDEKPEIPAFNFAWAERLLTYYLSDADGYFAAQKESRKALEKRLRREGFLHRQRVDFRENPEADKILAAGMNKLESIAEIVKLEKEQLDTDLRLVVLTDYIRKEFYVETPENTTELTKIGAVSVFEKLRRELPDLQRTAVLTGSLIILPRSCLRFLEEKNKSLTSYATVPFAPNYVVIKQVKNHYVSLLTELLTAGEIEVLIGTKALLGEGWDAPCVNTLVLASFVGSFVSSNQMRGRAIRTQRGNENKTANIWHLACLEPGIFTGGNDVEMLRRRFRNFTGISQREEAGIENGLGRINLPPNLEKAHTENELNEHMRRRAEARKKLSEKWKIALRRGTTLTEEIRIPYGEPHSYTRTRSLYFTKTLAYAFSTLFAAFIAFGIESIKMLFDAADNINSASEWFNTLTILGVVALILFGGKTLKYLSLLVKHRDIAKDAERIGRALLFTLTEEKIIKTPTTELEIVAFKDKEGAVYCYLEGGSAFEKSTFINALTEIVKPVENPRYIVVRKSRLFGILRQKDYHAVPEILAMNKKIARRFAEHWRATVGSCELVFTRTGEGRKFLLRARVRSLAAGLKGKPERVNKWV